MSQVETAARYRCAEIVSLAVDAQSQLVYARSTRSAKVLPREIVNLLSMCRTFDTLDNHARACCHQLHLQPSKMAATVRQQLADLATAGLMVSYRGLCERWTHGGADATPPPRIASVGFVTRNREEVLQRALASFIENGQRYGRTNDFVVLDDSDTEDTRERCQQMLKRLRDRYRVPIWYGGLEQKQRFADSLVKAGLPAEVVHFALFRTNGPPGAGANRNAFFLHTIGDAFVSADDDTVCRLAARPQFQEGLAISAASDFAEYWFYPDHPTMLRSVSFVEEDVLATQEQLLGKTLSECAVALGKGDQLNLDRMSDRFLKSLERGNGRVLVTMTGLVGDCGMTWPRWFLLGGTSRERLVKTASEYRLLAQTREIMRVASKATIDEGPSCQGTVLGFDNRSVLPPFFPVCRHEDDIFGVTLQKCFEDGYFGHVPWAILHEPQETRSFPPDPMLQGAASQSLSDLVMLCIRSCHFGPACLGPKDRLRSLGRHLIEIGLLAPSDFAEFLRLENWHHASTSFRWLGARLRQYKESPDFWAGDMKRYQNALREALLREDFGAPSDLMDGRTVEEACMLAQQLIKQFGQLLHWWPELLDAARALRQNGQRAASPVE